MVMMSLQADKQMQETARQSKSKASCPLKKRKGNREMDEITSDATPVSRYNNDNDGNNEKRQKRGVSDQSVDDEGSADSANDQPMRSSPTAKVVKPNSEEIRDDSESKKSKDTSLDDFIDIEKAQYTFPERLFELLVNGTVKKALWWLPGGEAFALVPNSFYDTVLSKYFQGTKFESFTRKLNRWGFKRLSGQGVPKGTIAYYHKMFKRDKPDLMKEMRSGKSQNDAPEDRTVFVGLDDVSPPALSMSMESNAARIQPFMSVRLHHPDTASALLAQQVGRMTHGGSMDAENVLKLQLFAQQQLAPSSLEAARQIMAEKQRVNAIAQMNAAAQSASSEMTLRRQAELLALEEIRAAQAQEAALLQAQEAALLQAQEAALLQAQLRSRLMQQQAVVETPASTHQGFGNSAGYYAAAGAAAVTNEQIRMLLLRRQIDRYNGGW